jgi:cytochrome c5
VSTSEKIAVLFVTAALLASGCEDGDWLGPVERGLRGAVNGWDMWATDSVRPYEDPMPPTVEGTVPVEQRFSFAAGAREVAAIPAEQRKERGSLTYRRYCHHCHGANGDGRTIVGESLDVVPADLRQAAIQSRDVHALYAHLQSGGKLMVPLAQTMSPAEMLLSIEHLHTLRNRPSEPFFEPAFTEPIR